MGVLFTPLGGAVAQLSEDSSDVAEPVAISDGNDTVSEDPALSAEQKDRALQLIAVDPRVQEVLGEKRYAIKELGVWGGYDDAGQPVPVTGAAVVIGLAQPTAFKMREWPLMVSRPYDAPGPPYRERNLQMEAANVTELLVNVDLQRERIVYIEPYGEDVQITPGPDLLAQAEPPSGD